MQISDVMTRNPVSAMPDSLVTKIALLMNENRLHAIPVVNGRNKVVGIITESDFFIKGSMNMYLPSVIEILKDNSMLDKMPENKKGKIEKIMETRAGEIMSSPCIALNYEASIDDFFELVKDKKLHSVPVVDSSHSLVGIITLADVMNLIKIN
ncbi:MAG: CBS-domain-containing membrane protein [Parcubacteria group bacterium GW2011_GWC1_45_14]|nr:MAG: CBS-domain-containing membrane protein [Candidatus Moranbacteria bacterium GW2011_GWC2_45_10]KKT95258.1 MAG: CBS-domain-containing membrane protein [Parcubacteria group bacterium GW2011_GWC1_45_14]